LKILTFNIQNITTIAPRTSEQGPEGNEENILNVITFSLFIPPH